jgi:two-component system sensor histidine kinase KdpD
VQEQSAINGGGGPAGLTTGGATPRRETGAWEELREAPVAQRYWLVALVMIGLTLPSFLVAPVAGHLAVGLVYLLAVVLMALVVGRGPTVFGAVLSALFWDYFFVPPIAHLRIDSVPDAVTFCLYLVTAVLLGEIAARMSAQGRALRHAEEQARTLYELTRGLAHGGTMDDMARQAVEVTGAAFGAKVVVLLRGASGELSFHAHPASTYDMPGPEQPVAERAFESGRMTGRFTKKDAQADALYVPLTAGKGAVGVMGLAPEGSEPITPRQMRVLDVFAQQIAMALDRQRTREEADEARARAKTEQLSRALLEAMSQEMREPIRAIRRAAEKTFGPGNADLSGIQRGTLREIGQAVKRLDELAWKLDQLALLEAGRVTPKPELCDVSEVLRSALAESTPELAAHKVELELPRSAPPVWIDRQMLMQALRNLLANVAAHTPAGTLVQLSARVKAGILFMGVADRGPGIPVHILPRMFEKFSRAGGRTSGAGLGLCVAKGLVECLGGHLLAENRQGGGAMFTIRLPVKSAV